MTQRTLCLLIKDDRVLLGMKKEGFGAGNYNGFGGKKEDYDLTIEDAAVRELFEESGITTKLEHITKKGELNFTFPHKPEWNQTVHVYIVHQWEGEPVESNEMKPEWFNIAEVPYSKMWEADRHWIPHVLQGKYVTASFTYGENKQILDKKILFK